MPTVIHGRRGRDTAIAEGAAQPRFRSVHVDAAPWREGRTIRLVLPRGRALALALVVRRPGAAFDPGQRRAHCNAAGSRDVVARQEHGTTVR